jgi:hypothetical protein
MLNWAKKHRWTAAILVALGALVAIGLLSLLAPWYGEICEKNEYTNTKECASHHIILVALWQIGEFLRSANGAITAVATVFLGFITWRLVILGIEQSRTSRAQLRAYVFLENAGIFDGPTWPSAPQPVAAGCPCSMIAIKNFGVTPAFNVRHWANVKFVAVTPDGHLQGGVLDAPAVLTGLGPSTIPPTGTTRLSRNLGRAITPYEMGLMAAPAYAIIVYGKITYDDTFGEPHETNYCAGYSGAWPPAPGTNLVYLSEGNGAT